MAEHPLRERLRGQLMLALYRSGRQARGARGLPGRARLRWSTSSGSSRAARLHELEQAILAQDAVARRRARRCGRRRGRSRRRWRRVRRPPARARGASRQALDDAAGAAWGGSCCSWRRARGSARAGSLRSCSATRPARGARGPRRPLLGGGRRAGLLAVGAVAPRVRPRRAIPDALREPLGAGAADLARLLPELRELSPDLAEPAAARSRGRALPSLRGRERLLMRRRAWRSRPLVLVLDDLHAADEPSLLLLALPRARAQRQCRSWSSGAYRDVDPTLRDTLSADARRAGARAAAHAGFRSRGLGADRRGAPTSSCAPDDARSAAGRGDPRGDRGQPAVRRRGRADARRRRAPRAEPAGRRHWRIPQGVAGGDRPAAWRICPDDCRSRYWSLA